MRLDINHKTFFELLKAGLWERDVRLSSYENVNFRKVYQIAEQQSVVGLVAAGLEHLTDIKSPQAETLEFVGSALKIEQRNIAMNDFVARLVELLRKEDVYTLLIKGQGIAQCYKRPLWRAAGDVDLLLNGNNYKKAKEVLKPHAISVEKEYTSFKHLGLTMEGGFVVELHGTLHSRLSKRVDKVIDEAQNDVFYNGSVRSWQNGCTQVFLPAPDSDIIFIFTHILHHFYIEGIGLRQICDWCRFLCTYKDTLNRRLLEYRIIKMGLLSEWKVFAALAVKFLGMTPVAMPLYDSDEKWSHKAEYIIDFILETGNFGHNRRGMNNKMSSARRKMMDFGRHASVFPLDSIRFFIHFMGSGMKVAIQQ